MNDPRDIEKRLKKFHHRPDSRVRRSVLNRFNEQHDPSRVGRRPAFFWSRPVPLYLAAATLVVAVGLSFFAGRHITLANTTTGSFPDSLLDTTFTLPQEVLWEPAQNDIL